MLLKAKLKNRSYDLVARGPTYIEEYKICNMTIEQNLDMKNYKTGSTSKSVIKKNIKYRQCRMSKI
jgi:hypothetical protein